MKIYTESNNYKLYQGNMLDMLEVIEANSIDSIVTDPPYELNFMGKGWDNAGVSFQKETWKQCYEVLKPGGYLLAFGGSRTFHRIACAIEDAGFEIRDTIMWLYCSGFPKSMDISKSLDKRNGRNYNDDFKTYINNKRLEKNISFKTINEKLGTSTNGGGMASNIFGNKLEKNNVLPTKKQYEIIKELLELDNRYDELININEAERKVIGQKKSSLGGTVAAGERNEDFIKEHKNKMVDITIPTTDLAKQWKGWGTCLKPSFEPIIVARKPFKGSLVDNVIQYGVGGINIDECRVAFNGDKWKNQKSGSTAKAFNLNEQQREAGTGVLAGYECKANEQGRFPANTILTYDETDFDEVCGRFPNTKGKIGRAGRKNGGNYNASSYKVGVVTDYGFKDEGSASRYFYCAKASKKDRDEGLDTFNQEKVNDGRQTPIDNPFQRGETPRRNVHPCVKPTELMQYLVRLVTPNNGTILDPFNGSGSTGKAVMYENKDRNKNYKYIGIELSEEYLEISKARINFALEQIEEQKKEEEDQISLWQD